jgi:hypothetical protein
VNQTEGHEQAGQIRQREKKSKNKDVTGKQIVNVRQHRL